MTRIARPIDGIPVDLREPLIRICLEHANGAVKRNGKLWLDFDPLSDPQIRRPYVFETPAQDEDAFGGAG